MSQIIWKAIPGYENIYEINNLGDVKRIGAWTDGRCIHIKGIRHPKKAKNGYLRLTLFRDKTKKEFAVHALVLLAFVGPKPSPIHQTNHKDGNRANNCLENLEYVTPSENQFHSYRVLKTPTRKGSKHHAAKITEEDVIAIRSFHSRGWPNKDLAKRFGISEATVCWIIKRKAWKHV